MELGTTTVTTYVPITSPNLFDAGRIRSYRRPNGRMMWYDYGYDTDTNSLTETRTEGIYTNNTFTLVAGKSSRQKTTYDVRGNAVRIENEAYIEDAWYPLTWETRTYSAAHKHLGSTYSNGKTSDSRWNCTGPIWEVGTDTIATTNTYNTLKQMVTSTRYGSFGALTTIYTYDAAGRKIRTQRGDLVSTTTYDLSGRVVSSTDEQGRTTTYDYPSEAVTVVTLPGGGTRITTLNADGRTASITGTAVTPEYYTYGSNWTLVHYGTPTSARWRKTYTDVLGRTVREEQGGANGSTLVTTYTYNTLGQLARVESTGQAPVVYTYDAWGDQIVTQIGERVPQETTTAYILIDGAPWQETMQKQGDLITRFRTNPDGTTQITTDVRGNEHTTTIVDEGAQRTTTQYRAGIANPTVNVSLDGAAILSVDSAYVTNSATYDVYQRLTTQTDGRGNTTTNVYDALGRLASTTDAAGAVTSYGYNTAGQVVAITNALGNVITYDYDVRGNKIYEGGATYPVTYTYDTFGQQVSMTTYRDEDATAGDTTTWRYDEASGALLSKEYADGHGVTCTLTDLGQVATRTDARGNVTTYSYDQYGSLLSQTYSDNTPSITYQYDNFGRQTQVTDAVGTTVFTYNEYGELTTEAITGLYTKTLTHHFDAYGRDIGYSVNGSRRTTLGYDAATGRLATLNEGGTFTWEYLPGSSLKSKLTYPSGISANWTYEPTRDLLTSVTNLNVTGEVISQYDYTNDILGRRTSKNEEQYGYNMRNELISADDLSYAYDDIGNRTVAEGRDYTANNLNQYTAIDTFTPEYDLDGNQTKILTSTGEWQVEYNAENRPIRWTQGNKVITMGYDRMGRRIFYKEMNGSTQVTYTCFLYNGYLCIQQLFSNSPWNIYKEFIWDPTEPMATRPLVFRQNGQTSTFLMHDGNKNVTDVVTVAPNNEVVGHYEYAPFGAITTQTGTRASANPFRFSSEFHDDTLGLVYYNYRHYNLKDGRWCGRDLLGEDKCLNLYSFCSNASIYFYDYLGLIDVKEIPNIMMENNLNVAAKLLNLWFSYPSKNIVLPNTDTIKMEWVLGFSRAKSVYENMKSKKVYVNDPAKKEIQKMLKRTVVGFSGSFCDLSRSVLDIDKDYVNYRSVGSIWDEIDDMFASLGRFNIRVAVSGTVIPEGEDKACVTITKLGFYVRDSYDFKGDQHLGYWNAETKYVGRNPFRGDKVTNKSFRDYQELTGFGHDFLLYSDVLINELDIPEKFIISL